ncbi:cytochrome bd-I oxidase subunit CydX [Verticiella sediminum]|uniref:Cytochrome bd-I oxidase subunit CydX n=1 Tax=Verticiella sediminum TaxID=1247510 RepID=A0A556AS66_9BURK|nr:cytochrome bd-I oxidase subunit CydX [Verticiella sediminum]TSH95760.1 cytochrome bd-I oxidase subunit CydX [Verticiella sediminum]
MWYFAWILGLGLAATFAVLNAMWYELMEREGTGRPAARGSASVGSSEDAA